MGELKDCYVYAFPKERRREEELRQEEACFGRCRPVLHETVQGSVACSSLERCELRVPTLLSAPCDNSLIHAPPKKNKIIISSSQRRSPKIGCLDATSLTQLNLGGSQFIASFLAS